MSFRLFHQPQKDSNSDYVKKMCNREKFQNVKILYDDPIHGLLEDYNDTCFKIKPCNQITSIKDYNILQKYNVFYNHLSVDICRNIIQNFNYTMNNSNYLKCEITADCLVQQLKPQDISCDYINQYDSTNKTNNLLIIDPSNLVFNPQNSCTNLFTKNTTSINYTVDNCSNVVNDIDSELLLCKNNLIKPITTDIGNIIFSI